jgi:hypothetical protein
MKEFCVFCLAWNGRKESEKKMKNFGFCLAGMTDRESENKNTKIFFCLCLEWQTGEWKLNRESCFCLAGNDKTRKIRQHLFYVHVYVLFSSHIEINDQSDLYLCLYLIYNVFTTSLTPLCFDEVSASSQESEYSCICVIDIDFARFYFFLLDSDCVCLITFRW